jgi:hypothetical protein
MPSTPYVLNCCKKDVDARHKAGHDYGEGRFNSIEKHPGLPP